MKLLSTLFFLTAVLALSSCDTKGLQAQIDEVNKNLGDMSDVGLISELGWLSKILRDSASGTPAEREKAREDIARLFGIDKSKLSERNLFEVTIKFDGFENTDEQQLVADVKYLLNDDPSAVKKRFSGASGNAFQPRELMSPEEFRRTANEIEALVRQRTESFVSAIDCETKSMEICYFDPFRRNSFLNVSGYGGASVIGAREQANTVRTSYINGLIELVLTPIQVTGLPASGSLNGQLQISWGETGGASPYAVVFVPKTFVAENPNMEIRGWLHLKDRQDLILGAAHQIVATDFADRCLGNTDYQNPTPPVDSLTSYGDLCWFAFDLFGTGVLSTLTQLSQEASAARDD